MEVDLMRFENEKGKITINGRELKSPVLRLFLGIVSLFLAALIVTIVVAVLLPVFGLSFNISVPFYFAVVLAVLVIIPTILAGSLITGIVTGSIEVFAKEKKKNTPKKDK